MGDVIVAEGLTKCYGRERGVLDLDFSVRVGEIFGYLGPNGAGKTTTIRILLDLIRPTTGRATVFGLDSRRDTLGIRRRVGYLPGELALYEHLTGFEYLSYLGSLRGGIDRRWVSELGERLSLDLSHRIRSLSHGNKQKVGLVQAFMHRPELLILDEPTQGLDPLVQQEFYRLVAEGKDQGCTVFLSSHVLPEIDRICDRAAIIREGRLVAVEDIGTMKMRSARTVEIHFGSPVPARVFAGLAGVHDVTTLGDVVRCTVIGSMDPLVKAAAGFDVVDLTSHEPGLEEVFLAYYGETPGAASENAPATPAHRGEPDAA
jgi:ABC-2 type transport system ATP-binding protein